MKEIDPNKDKNPHEIAEIEPSPKTDMIIPTINPNPIQRSDLASNYQS